MKKLLIPLVLMLVGVGGGVGAAMFLAPPADDHAEIEEVCACAPDTGEGDGHDLAADDHADDVPADPNDPAAGYEYARLNNQFIVPVVTEERVTALKAFHDEVTAQNFPYPETNIAMHPGEKDKFLEALDKWTPTHQ